MIETMSPPLDFVFFCEACNATLLWLFQGFGIVRVCPIARQRAADIWRGSNNAVRREILNAVCLNRTLTDVNLDATKRKPFDVFAKGLEIKNSRGDRIRTCDLLTPSQTRYQTAPHPE